MVVNYVCDKSPRLGDPDGPRERPRLRRASKVFPLRGNAHGTSVHVAYPCHDTWVARVGRLRSNVKNDR